MRDSFRAVRSLALGGTLLLTVAACSPMDSAMVAVFGRSMRTQPSVKPYEDPRGVPEGSVPFAAGNFAPAGQVNLGQPEGDAGVPAPIQQSDLNIANPSPAVVGLVNPIPASAESLARGEEMFLRTCAPCHGEAGDGNGYIVQSGAYPLVFSLLNDNVRAYADGYIYGIVRVGRGLMPAYGHQVTHQDRWHIVNYVRQLQGSPNSGGASATPGDQ
jgi:mono/diheme cytochrome c family protein